MNLRARLKRLLARFMVLIEFCHQCGRQQPLIWTADDDLWLELIGHPGDVLCPECFDKLARTRGLLLRWIPVPMNPIPKK